MDFLGDACGMLCIGMAVRSGDVTEHGRSIWVTSIPRINRFPAVGVGIDLIKIFWSSSRLIDPLLKALYKLDQLRGKNAESDSSGKDCAWLSLIRASIVLNNASPARSKLV